MTASRLSMTKRAAPAVAGVLVGVLFLTACGSSKAGAASAGSASSPAGSVAAAADADQEVAINLTSKGCQPEPATINAGHVNFTITNKNAGAVSEAELRTSDLSHILGEQENLTPGLSGGFSLNIQPGSYTIACPGASTAHWDLTVSGATTGATWQSNADLSAAVAGYSSYITANVGDLVTHTQAFCDAITAGNLDRAELLYSPARIYYERIEPVAEIWGDLDVDIDGRWENPTTVASQFMGFHRIEQLLWQEKTLTGAAALCSGLVDREKQLQTLVASAEYSPLEMAAGATDLINEAATAKITGEEERYSNVDLPTFKGNVDGAMEVFTLLKPYLGANDPTTVTLVQQRYQAVLTALAPLQATPGYLNTGYLDYSKVTDAERRTLSGTVNAFAESLSTISDEVS
jgi:iron uptake system component EfeO